MELSEKNCTGCKKYFRKPKSLTIVIDPKRQTMDSLCEKCLDNFKEMTKDSKVAIEVTKDESILYCYRCGLRTKDNNLFLRHDCIKMKTNIDFTKSLLESDHNDQ